MNERGVQLHETADTQISELIGLLSVRGEAVLSLPCPGREKMGDGTVAAVALHTADRYQLIAEFLHAAAGQMPRAGVGSTQVRHRIPRFLLARGHGPAGHGGGEHDSGMHDGDYTVQSADLDGLIQRLSAARDALSVLSELTDEQLGTVPPAGSFRFCDGQRSLAQVLSGLVTHQGHQVDAMKAAVG